MRFPECVSQNRVSQNAFHRMISNSVASVLFTGQGVVSPFSSVWSFLDCFVWYSPSRQMVLLLQVKLEKYTRKLSELVSACVFVALTVVTCSYLFVCLFSQYFCQWSLSYCEIVPDEQSGVHDCVLCLCFCFCLSLYLSVITNAFVFVFEFELVFVSWFVFIFMFVIEVVCFFVCVCVCVCVCVFT